MLDRLSISLQAGEHESFANAVALSGALSVSVPEQTNLVGFLLLVDGYIGLGGKPHIWSPNSRWSASLVTTLGSAGVAA